MELNKRVTSRKGNIFNVYLKLNASSVETIIVKDEKGEQLFVGSGGSNTNKREDYLIKLVEDVVLWVEEDFSNYQDLKSFENWDGVIN
jgi:hypothetical protein